MDEVKTVENGTSLFEDEPIYITHTAAREITRQIIQRILPPY